MLLSALLRFRSLYRHAQSYPGFIRGQVSLAGPRTIMNVSLWRSRKQMLAWSGTDPHVVAVRLSQRQTLEVWSVDARLSAVSAYSHRWSGELVLGSLSTTLAPSGRTLTEEVGARGPRDPRGLP